VGESANLALYSIVRERGLIPDRTLSEALDEAQRDMRPLEQILMGQGLLSATRERPPGPRQAGAVVPELR
jgi:hypothetical protein